MSAGINAYSRPGPNGGVVIDVEAMTVDLITVFKAGGHSLQELQTFITDTWPAVSVQISIPKGSKN